MTVTYHDPCHLGRQGEPYVPWKGKRVPGQIILFDPPKTFRRGTMACTTRLGSSTGYSGLESGGDGQPQGICVVLRGRRRRIGDQSRVREVDSRGTRERSRGDLLRRARYCLPRMRNSSRLRCPSRWQRDESVRHCRSSGPLGHVGRKNQDDAEERSILGL